MIVLKDGRADLHQWDTGRILAVDPDINELHFAKNPMGRSLDVDATGGEARIPDVLLQTPGDLHVWAYVGTPEDGYTKVSKIIKIQPRNKPADYVFTPQEQTTLKQVMERLDRVPGDIEEALAEAKASGEFDGEPGKDGSDGQPGEDYVLTDADRAEIAGQAAESVFEEHFSDVEWMATTTRSEGAEILNKDIKFTSNKAMLVVSFAEGTEYLVEWNGTQYICTAKANTSNITGSVIVGNEELLTNAIVTTGEPFCFTGVFIYKKGSGAATIPVRVVELVKEYNKMPEEYLPDCVVKSVNGVSPDENGNVTVEVGGGWTIDELTAETEIADDDTLPFYDTSAKGQRKTLWSNIKAVLKTYFDTVYLKRSGGTLTGKIVLPTDNQNVGFTNSGDMKILGYGNIDSISHLRIGDATRPVQLRGSTERPKYNDGELVLKSEFDIALGSYITDIDALIGGDA